MRWIEKRLYINEMELVPMAPSWLRHVEIAKSMNRSREVEQNAGAKVGRHRHAMSRRRVLRFNIAKLAFC